MFCFQPCHSEDLLHSYTVALAFLHLSSFCSSFASTLTLLGVCLCLLLERNMNCWKAERCHVKLMSGVSARGWQSRLILFNSVFCVLLVVFPFFRSFLCVLLYFNFFLEFVLFYFLFQSFFCLLPFFLCRLFIIFCLVCFPPSIPLPHFLLLPP